jgi:MFS family permease
MCYRTSTNVRRSDSKTFKDFIGEIRQILKKNKNFKNYIFSRILLTANYPAISLYAVYAKDKMNFEMSEAGIFIVISTTVSALSGYITGKFGDKFGHKNAMVFVFLAYFFALVSALWATSLLHVYIIFVFLGIGMGGWLTSAMSLIYEFAGDGDIKIYFALTDSLTAPFVLLSIILAGICAPRFGIEAVLIGIGIFIVLGIFSLVFLTKDPKDYS